MMSGAGATSPGAPDVAAAASSAVKTIARGLAAARRRGVGRRGAGCETPRPGGHRAVGTALRFTQKNHATRRGIDQPALLGEPMERSEEHTSELQSQSN